MLEHGGRLLQAVQRYGGPRERWLDLSTGINPSAWQGEPVPLASWNRLPEDEDGLTEAATKYYGAPLLLPVSGSQAAIQALPRLRQRGRVGVPVLGYNEHGHRWKQAGHDVVPLAIEDFESAIRGLDVLVVSNPNNPTGHKFTPTQLLDWHARLQARGGWLVVDEAFQDATPEGSVAIHAAEREGLIVLRSLGKFFGLAGARVGFALATEALLARLSDYLGPWTLAGPSRHIAKAALNDRPWHEATRGRLHEDSQRLADTLTTHGLTPTGGCALFQWIRTPRALKIHQALAKQAVLTRYFDSDPSLRFGLPGHAQGWERLERALREAL